MAKNLDTQKILTWILIIGSVLGIIAATILTIEKIELAKDPSHQLSCSLNPVLSCGPIIGSDQASAFGFPNPFLGLVGFGITLCVGMALLAKAKFAKWFWLGLQAGTTFGMGFVLWLIFQSLYDLGALCLYCMLVWSVTWPMFWYTTLYNLEAKNITIKNKHKHITDFASKHQIDILVSFYVIVIILIGFRFWDYWQTLI